MKDLEDRVALLEYKFGEVCDTLYNWQVPRGIHLPRAQLIMANTLRKYSPSIVNHSKIFDMIDSLSGLYCERSHQSMKVQICSLRSNLKQAGVDIKTHHGIGYSMAKEAADKWDKLCRVTP